MSESTSLGTSEIALRIVHRCSSDHRVASGTVMRERARRASTHRDALLPVVYTSVIGLDNDAPPPPEWPVHQRPSFVISQTPQVMLDFIVLESDAVLHCALHYVDGLFPVETIDGMVDTLRRGIETLDREAGWTAVAIDPSSRDRARFDTAPTARGVPNVRLEELFLSAARTYADNLSVISSARTITYRELERVTAGLAASIIKGQTGPPPLIAVIMDKGWEQVAAILAILRAGAAYVPIDPHVPHERLDQLIDACQVDLVLTQSAVDARLQWPSRVQRLLVDREPIASDAGTTSLERFDAGALAYVIHTSGSTGSPKGVMITHRAAANTILEVNRICGVSSTDRVLSVSSLSFDLSVYDIFGPLAVGAAVVLPDAQRDLDPSHWLNLIHQANVTVWNSVPALLDLLLDRSNHLACVRLALLSGDWIPLTLPNRLRAVAPDVEVLAMGGATEASIWSIHRWVNAVDPSWSSIPYGVPLANQSCYVLDGALQPSPTWTPGELYIGGAGVASGYFGDETLTSARFLRHPETGERLYRTGDLGRYLPDGEIEFLGRKDTQVKVFGHRIELGEIEAAVLAYPGVQRCAVTALGKARHLNAVAAYVVWDRNAPKSLESLRRFLAERLPRHMVPRHIVRVDRLPLTANGKVDRNALPPPQPSPADQRPHVSPRTETEVLVASFWEDVLQVKNVGIHDDFFDLGGDSLAATRVAARVNETLGSAATAGTVLHHPTIADFCAHPDIATLRSSHSSR